MKKNTQSNVNILIAIVATLVMGVMTACGAYEQPVPEAQTVENNSVKITKDGDPDGDMFVPGELDIFVQQKCEFQDSESMEKLCTETVMGALKGGNDCDNFPGDDPAECPQIDQSGLDCSVPANSVCAKCINTSAVEVYDGVDNDCNGTMLDGECGDDADCAEGEVCNLDTNKCEVEDLCAGVVCNDQNSCTDDACVPATGLCGYTNDNTNTCSDNSLCTTDACVAGACTSVPVVCNDQNPCTDDACNPATGLCVSVPGDPSCCSEDADCTNGKVCDVGTHTCVMCLNAADCDDGDVCTTDTCVAGACVYTNNILPCDDGNACTTGDVCAAGLCVPGLAVVCDDANLCTTDTCVPATGCVYTNNILPCGDGNKCNGDEVCFAGACQQGVALNCSDNNACTTDSCVPATGCAHAYILGCAATCDPAHDLGPQGEAGGDCAPYRDPQLASKYGWGCSAGKCAAYEDLDGDEYSPAHEAWCDDEVDGDLDGKADCDDADCTNSPVCAPEPLCNAQTCTGANHCEGDYCVANAYKIWCWDGIVPGESVPHCHTHTGVAGTYWSPAVWAFTSYLVTPPACGSAPAGVNPPPVQLPFATCCVSGTGGLGLCQGGATFNPYL